jgi:hypothetical protein
MAINAEGIKPDIYRLAAELEGSFGKDARILRNRIVAVYGQKAWIDVVCYVLAGLHSRAGEIQGIIEVYEEAFPEIFVKS